MSIRIFGSGGGVINDATATPEDVREGRIFYNNDGRQEGINPGVRHMIVSTMSLPDNTYNPVTSSASILSEPSSTNGYTYYILHSGYSLSSYTSALGKYTYCGFVLRSTHIGTPLVNVYKFEISDGASIYLPRSNTSSGSKWYVYPSSVGSAKMVLTNGSTKESVTSEIRPIFSYMDSTFGTMGYAIFVRSTKLRGYTSNYKISSSFHVSNTSSISLGYFSEDA